MEGRKRNREGDEGFNELQGQIGTALYSIIFALERIRNPIFPVVQSLRTLQRIQDTFVTQQMIFDNVITAEAPSLRSIADRMQRLIDMISGHSIRTGLFDSAAIELRKALGYIQAPTDVVDITGPPPKEVGEGGAGGGQEVGQGGAPGGVHGSAPGEVDDSIFDQKLPDKLSDGLDLLYRRLCKVFHNMQNKVESEVKPIDRLGTIAEYLGYFADGARNSAKNLEKRIEAVEKENKELKDKLLCNLCFKNEPDTFLYVCKHRFCEPCVKILNEGDPPLCPVCRKVMKTYERFF